MERVKYPRTYHLPWSMGATSDDKVLKSVDHFVGKKVVVTEKMDGENTTLYRDGLHARSLDSKHHESRNWIKAFHASIAHKIPSRFRICGENMYAKHSIYYEDLESYFYGFAMFEEFRHEDWCSGWHNTQAALMTLGIPWPKVLYEGEWNELKIRNLLGFKEGYVVRLVEPFKYKDFDKSVAKYVRQNHVQTDEHWMHGEIIPNKLKPKEVWDDGDYEGRPLGSYVYVTEDVPEL